MKVPLPTVIYFPYILRVTGSQSIIIAITDQSASQVFPTFSQSSTCQPAAHQGYWHAPTQSLFLAAPYKPAAVPSVPLYGTVPPTISDPQPFDAIAVVFQMQKKGEVDKEKRKARVKLLIESLGLQLASINDFQANGYTIGELIVLMEKLLTCAGRLSRHYQQIVVSINITH